MKKPVLPSPLNRWPLLCGVGLIALGLTALVGRFTGELVLVTLLPGGSPMAFFSAVGFVLGGGGLVAHALGRARLGQGLGGVLAALGTGLLFFFTARNHFGLFANALSWVDQAGYGLRFRGPASLTSSACLAFLGVALGLLGRPRFYVRTLLVGGAVMFAFSSLALIGYLTQMERYSVWWRDTGMALPVALGLMGAAAVLVVWALEHVPRERSETLRLLPLFVAVTGLVGVAGVTALVSNQERERVNRRIEQSTEALAALDLLMADCDRLDAERVNARFRGVFTRELTELEKKLGATLARVRNAMAGSPARQAELAEVERLLGLEFETARRQTAHQPTDRMMPLSVMPMVRFKLQAFVGAEREALITRRQLARDAALRTDNIIVLGNAFAAALGVLAMLFLRRANRARDQVMMELRDSEERFRAAFDSAGVAMALVALDGRWLRVNRALCDLLGYEEEVLYRKTFQELTHPADLSADLSLVREVLSGKRRGYQIEKRYLHRQGKHVWGRLTVSLVTSVDGQPVNFVSQIEDITERLQLVETIAQARDAAVQASQLKSEFLANMSHEIRTPMNGVMGMASLLLDTPLTEDQRDMGRTIQQSAENLLLIINDVLDFSKIEAGKLSIEDQAFDLQLTVDATLALLAPRAAEKGLALHCEIDPRLSLEVRGDAGRIRQVLTNLVGNAVKFTDRGEVRVKLLGLPLNETATKVRFEVHDTGIGIPAEGQSQLFQPFTQMDGTTTRRFGGTGLGLAISRQLVELMGGTIGLASEVGRGSQFWFELPLRKASAVRGDEPSLPVSDLRNTSGLAGLKILVVEDNPVNQIVARRLLEKAGCTVEVANNGCEALQRLAGVRYDLVLMDCQMPEMDGYTATQQIRAGQVAGANPRIPIIALTAYAMQGDREKCLAAGMDEYVTKPLRLEQLSAALVKLNVLGAGPKWRS